MMGDRYTGKPSL